MVCSTQQSSTFSWSRRCTSERESSACEVAGCRWKGQVPLLPWQPATALHSHEDENQDRYDNDADDDQRDDDRFTRLAAAALIDNGFLGFAFAARFVLGHIRNYRGD